jgi:ATP-dependent DNA helicase RecQ
MTAIHEAQEKLRKYFGLADFREGQAEVIRSVLEGNDALVVMPTGSGKSLCYQLPATMSEGATVVVSPLIALMKDQVETLGARGLSATYINSSLGYREVIERLRGVQDGRYKLIYVAPERFRNEAFARSIEGARVSLLAIDEAHCISHWGHDFRPDYLKLRSAAQVLDRPPIVALTATATVEVRQDIVEQLGLKEPRIFVTGFDRPNLALRVVHVSGEKDKLSVLKGVISRSTGSGVVYAATRKSAEQITSRLKMAGFGAEAYHGGMSEDERNRAQNRFMGGEAQAIVATNAFGMGIDKSDIRFVVHYHIPGSIEQYYQEVGRAGRDEAPAQCTLMFNYADTRTQQYFIDGSNPPADFIERVHDAAVRLAERSDEVTPQGIAAMMGVRNEMSVRSALAVLEKKGIIERGRQTETAAMVSLTVPVDAALGAVPVPSIESTVLDDLVYGWNISEREDTELDVVRIASDLGIGPGHVRTALTGLAKRGLIKYRTAFRGRGVRLVKRVPMEQGQDRPELGLDRTELAIRGTRSQAKLRKMVEYCYSKACLRRFVLTYFGDPKHITRCGACSSCDPESVAGLRPSDQKSDKPGVLMLKNPARRASRQPGSPPVASNEAKEAKRSDSGVSRQLAPVSAASTRATDNSQEAKLAHKSEAEKGAGSVASQPGQSVPATAARIVMESPAQVSGRALTAAEIVIVKKVLSCVARLNDRFGKGTIARVLAGSSSAEISAHGLSRIPTFGVLADMQLSAINQFIRALISAGCVEVNRAPYPILRLSEFGRDVMSGRAEVLLDFAESQEI